MVSGSAATSPASTVQSMSRTRSEPAKPTLPKLSPSSSALERRPGSGSAPGGLAARTKRKDLQGELRKRSGE